MRLPSERTSTGLLHKVYEAATTCALPVAALALLASRRGRTRYAERFGCWEKIPPVAWWFHGASVGEVQGLLPLISSMREATPSDRVLLSATSPTGLTRGEPIVDYTRLAPLDAPWVVDRALKELLFDRFVVCETEFWPCLFDRVLSRGVPCHVVNGRISDYTQGRYRALRELFAPALRRFRSVCVPDERQRGRFIDLGVDPARISVTGHTKYDTAPRYAGAEARREARAAFFPDIPDTTPLVVLGSIRPGEESYWFSALRSVWNRGFRCRVVVAPRHAEKYSYFWDAIRALGVPCARWSTRATGALQSCDVLLLDEMGHLERAYAGADLAFVGATLVDIGGHNPFEPAMYGVPVVVGPYISVIRELIEEMRVAGGVLEASTEDTIYDILERLCGGNSDDAMSVRSVGIAGQSVWGAHRGASQRVLAAISESEESR